MGEAKGDFVGRNLASVTIETANLGGSFEWRKESGEGKKIYTHELDELRPLSLAKWPTRIVSPHLPLTPPVQCSTSAVLVHTTQQGLRGQFCHYFRPLPQRLNFGLLPLKHQLFEFPWH